MSKKGTDWTELFKRSVDAAAMSAADGCRLSLELAISGIESPIEKAFLIAFIFLCDNDREVRSLTVITRAGLHLAYGERDCTWGATTLTMQKRVGRYLSDFCLTTASTEPYWAEGKIGEPELLTTTSSICIEVDGHEFHEKTKQQATHDKQRDRYFIAQGLTVVRFTGSEIYRDVDRCVREAWALLSSRHDADVDATEAAYEREFLRKKSVKK